MKKLFVILMLLCGVAQAQVQNQNTNVQVLASATQNATTVNSADFVNTSYQGGHFIINVSGYGNGSYTPHIQGKDPVSGTYYDILVGNAISATGVTILKVYPGAGVIANGAASDILPLIWRVQLIGTGGPAMTLSVSASLEF